MKFSLSWISEHIEFKPNISIETISNSLTKLGLEVESINDPSKKLQEFLIGKILEVSPHPNADKLNICKVDLGKSQVSVVCGALNVKNNLKVVFAPLGATIPSNNLVLKKKDIRGYIGEGMLCSFEELCLEEKSTGIIELSDDAPTGEIYADWSGIADPIFEVGLTPNRGDCASIRGIARELASIGLGKLKDNIMPRIKGSYKSPIKWNLELDRRNKNACSYVKGRHFKGLKNSKSPDWLKSRLNSIGLKPISVLVDLTNFITFDLGRPLHVFDSKKLRGNLSMRMANQGERILALDNKDYKLNENILIIADENGPVSIAGVMGGQDSSCDEFTTEMFLESAYFNPKNIASSGRQLNILSDARYRFERGVDPDYVDEGINIMTNLVLDICGGEVSEEVYAGTPEIEKKKVEYNYSKVNKLAGIEVDKKQQDNILKSLGFELEVKGDKLNLLIPSWRHDIDQEVDIVEEIVRIYGYDKLIDNSLKNYSFRRQTVLSFDEYRNRLISSALVKRGLYEAVTFSFLSFKDHQLYSSDIKPIILDNPISEELSVMRQSLLPNLINNFIKNINKGLNNSGLYEVGSIYLGDTEDKQVLCSAGIRAGSSLTRHWAVDSRDFDIYDVKKDAFSALTAAGINTNSLVLNKDIPKWYHPGRGGSINLGKSLIGYFGELHPKYTEIYGMRILCFELFHNKMPRMKKKKINKAYISYSLMPIRRDFAFLTEINTSAEEVIKSIKMSINSFSYIKLIDINLFDVYSRNLNSKKHKSLGLEVVMQPTEKTLKDNEIQEISNAIVNSVKEDTNAVLRD